MRKHKPKISGLVRTEPPPRSIRVEIRDTVKDTKPFGKLDPEGCMCGAESTFLCYPEDGACECGTYKHHVHCGRCKGVSQWG